jgi:hypothetical protein
MMRAKYDDSEKVRISHKPFTEKSKFLKTHPKSLRISYILYNVTGRISKSKPLRMTQDLRFP